MLTHLMKTCEILKVTSLTLSEILNSERTRMPKNSSKAAKIRKLMSLETVRAAVTGDELALIEQALCEQERQRNQKKKEAETKEDEAEDEEDMGRELYRQSHQNENDISVRSWTTKWTKIQ